MEETQNKLLPKTFFWLFLGLLGTAIMSIFSYTTGVLESIANNGFFTILMVAEVAVVLIFSLLYRKLPAPIVGILYFIYSFLNGVSLSSIFYVFELNSIIIVFFGAAAMFATLGFIGYKMKVNLSRWQPVVFGTLLVGFILSIINLFLRNSFLDLMLDWFILITIAGVTIYDMNKVKELEETEDVNQEKLHIYFAMQLYLDFINIFIRILSLFGKRRK